MEYLYCNNRNFEDFSSGRVLYGGEGIPNFPVRLLNEIFGRALSHSGKKTDLNVYDPCCGGGYSLTVLGFFHSDIISRIYGSDIDSRMTDFAKRNIGLLTMEGIHSRRLELKDMLRQYKKESHAQALQSLDRLQAMLQKELPAEIFQADCTKELPPVRPDIIVTDIPYGNLATWKSKEDSPLYTMLHQLARISHKGTVLAVITDKGQKIDTELWTRREKQSVGKRKFEILQKT